MKGRPKVLPGEICPYRIGKNYHYPEYSEKKHLRRGGKIGIRFEIPAALYDQILLEAKSRNISFARQALEYLTAGACPE